MSSPLLSVIILAGGRSRRLGRDKAFLPLDGRPLIEHIVQKLTLLSDDLVVVANDLPAVAKLALPARLIPDERPGEGSLMGIYSGLKAARGERALVVACDMPFLSLPLLRYLAAQPGDYDVVIPRFGGLYEPLHAVYARTCLPAMTRLLARGGRQIIAFFPEMRIHCVEEEEVDPLDPDHLSFLNVNTPEDWDRVQALWAGGVGHPPSPGGAPGT